MTALIDDLSALEAASKAPGASGQAVVESATRNLVGDDVKAHALGAPGNNLDSRWLSVLGQIDDIRGLLGSGPSILDTYKLAQVSSQTEVAAESLGGLISLTERQGS